jgi:hypothetical protein
MKLLLTRYVTNVLIIIIVPLTWSDSISFIYLLTHSLTPSLHLSTNYGGLVKNLNSAGQIGQTDDG